MPTGCVMNAAAASIRCLYLESAGYLLTHGYLETVVLVAFLRGEYGFCAFMPSSGTRSTTFWTVLVVTPSSWQLTQSGPTSGARFNPVTVLACPCAPARDCAA